MARAMWKGTLQLGELAVPVKLYAAAQDRDVHFHMLHDHDQVRVPPAHGRPRHRASPCRAEEIRAGYEVEPGVFVLLSRRGARKRPRPSRHARSS